METNFHFTCSPWPPGTTKRRLTIVSKKVSRNSESTSPQLCKISSKSKAQPYGMTSWVDVTGYGPYIASNYTFALPISNFSTFKLHFCPLKLHFCFGNADAAGGGGGAAPPTRLPLFGDRSSTSTQSTVGLANVPNVTWSPPLPLSHLLLFSHLRAPPSSS
jgi:hypothetical protein